MWSSHAAHRKVSYNGLHARQPHRAVVLHTNGGGTDRGSLFGLWSGNASGRNGYDNRHIGAQFQITTAGHAEQYVDTDLVVYHAYSASEWAVGIETEDDGHPAAPWTAAQCNTIIAICHELEIPGQLLLSTPSDGLGWHEQYLAWNKEKHSCPGHVREQQIHDVILPALRQPTPKPHHPPAPKPPTPAPVEEETVKVIRIKGTTPQFAAGSGGRWWIENPQVKAEYVAAGMFTDEVHDMSAAAVNAIPLIGKAPA